MKMPNAYLDSIGPAWSSVHEALNPTGPSSPLFPLSGAPRRSRRALGQII